MFMREILVEVLFIYLLIGLYSVVIISNNAAHCSGLYHRIVNSLDKRGYEAELRVALKSARPLDVKHLKACIAVGGPEIWLQSQNSRYRIDMSACLCRSSVSSDMISDCSFDFS